jgi:hypothetical protein
MGEGDAAASLVHSTRTLNVKSDLVVSPSFYDTDHAAKLTVHEGIVHRIHSLDTVTSFQSAYLEPTSTFSVTFTYAGTYRYECSLHNNLHKMTGTIVVLPRMATLPHVPRIWLQTSAPGSTTTITGQQGTLGENGGDLVLEAGEAGAAGARAGVVRVGGDLEVRGSIKGALQLTPNDDAELPNCRESIGGATHYQSSGSMVMCMRVTLYDILGQEEAVGSGPRWMWRVMESREYCPVGSSTSLTWATANSPATGGSWSGSSTSSSGCTKCGVVEYANRMGMRACAAPTTLV